MCVNNLPRVAPSGETAGNRTRNLLITNPTSYRYATKPHNVHCNRNLIDPCLLWTRITGWHRTRRTSTAARRIPCPVASQERSYRRRNVDRDSCPTSTSPMTRPLARLEAVRSHQRQSPARQWLTDDNRLKLSRRRAVVHHARKHSNVV